MENYGWVGKILRVDLTRGRVEEQPTTDYVPNYIGGRGIATRIAWEELRPGLSAFSPDNLLMIFTGPLTGTMAPFSGRVEVCGLAPQGWPVEWFSRSGMGGHWGPELKYAGYDGIVIKGVSEQPVYISIEDGRVQVRNALHLWGKGTYETQRLLMEEHGSNARVVAIGQAGENLCRIASVCSETESAAGQGGFGAVMGSKKLKAIVVRGSGSIKIAHPDEFRRKSLAIREECHTIFSAFPNENPGAEQRRRKYGERAWACSQQCSAPCAYYYRHVPAVVNKGQVYAGQLHCAAPLFEGLGPGQFYDWQLGFEAGFEIAKLANDWGLNHWELLFGLYPWLRDCWRAGILDNLDGLPIDLNDPSFWVESMRRIAFREGIGDVLAEGGWRAQEKLGWGQDQARPLYAAWGYAGHWDGHGDWGNFVVFPYWVVAALQWAVDTRDPMSSGHGYAQGITHFSKLTSPEHGLDWDKFVAISERLLGNGKAMDPLGGYEGKAAAAHYHTLRSALKDSAPVDDQMFPRIFSVKTEDGFARADDMEGPDFEYHLIKEATGIDWEPAELMLACERIINIDRALQVRDYGRTRKDDERVIPYFATTENWVNPLLGEKQSLDAERFRQQLTELYRLRGWDPETGWPTEAKLRALGLPDVAEALRVK